MSSHKLEIKGFFHKDTWTVTYVVTDPVSKSCAIIDPVLDYQAASGKVSTDFIDTVCAYIDQAKLKVQWILETHVHADHMAADAVLKERYGAPVCIGDQIGLVQETFKSVYNLPPETPINGSQFDHLFADEECFVVGDVTAKAVATPGHTPACISYLIGDALFVGDALFMPDYGSARCDFPGGDAGQLYDSLQRLLTLPDDTRFFTCHDYAPGGREVVWESTIGAQKRENIHLSNKSREEFIELRETRDADLSMPALILPSIQVNMQAGKLPVAEENGVAYLKIPLNQF
ncbi:MAG: MBL fold metallo-hydrolase [Rhodospirillales bacterium]|nr:MBL fold metallo-hydrolase [Rhodospirillales bacterium]